MVVALIVKKYKQEYVGQLGSTRRKNDWDPKEKHHVQDASKQGYLTKAIQSFYVNLKDALSDSKEMKNACKLAKCCYQKLKSGDLDVVSKKFHSLGGGRKSRAGEVRDALFQWFAKFILVLIHVYGTHYSF